MSISLQRTRSEDHLSDFALDGLVGGALEGEREAGARAHLASCAECRGRIAAFEHDQTAARAELPAFNAPRPLLRKNIAGGLGLALAAAIAGLVLFIPERTDLTQTKGGAALGFFVRHGDKVRRGGDREVVSPGDALRFYYSLEQPRYLRIISRDAAGKVSEYYKSGAAPEPAGREVMLESAVLLDDTLGKEELEAHFCETPAENCTVVKLELEKRR